MRTIVSAMVLVTMVAGAASADKIYMRDGRLLNARITDEDSTSLLIETETSWERVQKSNIEMIRKESSVPAAAASSSPAFTAPAASTCTATAVPVVSDVAVSSAAAPSPARSGTEDYSSFEEAPRVYPQRRTTAAPVKNNESNEGLFKVGIDMAGRHQIDVSGGRSISDNVSSGLSMGVEFVHFFDDNVGLGGGIGYMVPRRMNNYRGDFYFIPFYGALRIRSVPVNGVSFYGTGQFGFNSFGGDSDYRGSATLTGGVHAGLGAGVTFKPLFVELLYTIDEGTYKLDNYYYDVDASVQYTKCTLSIGVSFP